MIINRNLEVLIGEFYFFRIILEYKRRDEMSNKTKLTYDEISIRRIICIVSHIFRTLF
jgi:hypothetical protein